MKKIGQRVNKMEIIQAFGCSYCGMASRYKASVIRHEAEYCKSNQSRKACINCVNWIDDGEDSDGSGNTWRACGCLKDVSLDVTEKENNNCNEFKGDI